MPGLQHEPSVAVDPLNHNHLVMAAIDSTVGKIGFSRSIDAGAHWSAFTSLNVPGYEASTDPSAAFDKAGIPYIAGMARNFKETQRAVFLAKSLDGGLSFPTVNILLPADSPKDKPWMTIDTSPTVPTRIFITWVETADASIWVGYSNNGINLIGRTRLGFGGWPIVASDNNGNVARVYVAWMKNGETNGGCFGDSLSCKILISRSVNRGVDWPLQQPKTVWDTTGSFSCFSPTDVPPGLTLGINDDPDGSRRYPFIAWHDCDDNGNANIWFVRSTDFGDTWPLSGTRVNDDSGTAQQFMPTMAARNGEVYVAFYDTRFSPPNMDIYFAESSDAGVSFGANMRVSDTSFPVISGLNDYMGLAAGPDAVFPIWTDSRNGSGTGNDIYIDRLTSPGGSVAYGTLITTGDGSRVPVQNLREGSTLLLYDVYTGSSQPALLTTIRAVRMGNMMTLHTDRGLPLRVDANPNLRLYTLTDTGPVLRSVLELQPGNSLYNYDLSDWVAITRIEISYGGWHEFYDLITSPHLSPDGHYLSFIANGYADPCEIPCKLGPGQ